MRTGPARSAIELCNLISAGRPANSVPTSVFNSHWATWRTSISAPSSSLMSEILQVHRRLALVPLHACNLCSASTCADACKWSVFTGPSSRQTMMVQRRAFSSDLLPRCQRRSPFLPDSSLVVLVAWYVFLCVSHNFTYGR